MNTLEFREADPRGLPLDALEHKFALLAALRPGWDGPGSVAPRSAALRCVYEAVSSLIDINDRDAVQIGAHGDGYLAIDVRGEAPRYADVHEDHIEYEGTEGDWDGPLDPVSLRSFLTGV